MSLLGAFIVPHPPLILPSIGRGQERRIQKTVDAYHEIARRIADLKPDTIILTSPHALMYTDYFHISSGKNAYGDFGSFGVPQEQMRVCYDLDFVKELTALAEEFNLPAGTFGDRAVSYDQNGKGVSSKALDHGTMVPLYFVNQYFTDYKLVRISISGLPSYTHYRLGECISKIIENSNKRYVFIASGDLSHKLTEEGPYGYAKEGVQFDNEVTKAISEGDFMRFLSFPETFTEEAAECGLRSFLIMAGALDGKAVNSQLLSYEGPFGVGYAVAAFTMNGRDEQRQFGRAYLEEKRIELLKIRAQEDAYVKLARMSLEYFVKKYKRMKQPGHLIPELLQARAGVFVSIKKDGKLRGCIGTIMPSTDSIADEIIQNAISAGMNDPRFPPIQEEELPWLIYDVDVLMESEPINSMEELDVKRYGVIVSYKGRRGLLLPNLEGVNTVEQQVSIALQKANISRYEPYKMERFEVVRHL